MHKTTLLLFTVCVGMVVALPLVGQQLGGAEQSSTATENHATPLSGGLPPEPAGKHKVNSTLYSATRTRRDLTQRAKEEKSIDMLIDVPMPFFSEQPGAPLTLRGFVRQQVCSSDAVVVAHVMGKESYLTESKDWVFTDYDLVVDEAVKSTGVDLEPGSQVTVTRTGGELVIYGHPVKATDSLYRPFQVGETYVLFLRFLPISASYQALGPGGSYKLASGKIAKLTDGSLIPELNQPFDWGDFRKEIMVPAASACDAAKGDSK